MDSPWISFEKWDLTDENGQLMEFDGDVSGIEWDRTHAMDLTGDSMDCATSLWGFERRIWGYNGDKTYLT